MKAVIRKNEKHINIDDVINIDFIREQKELHEVKKSKAVEEAGIWQVKVLSILFAKARSRRDLKGKIDYPLLKEVSE